ncbi:MAG: hypothetical protein ACFFAJ_13570, partial [Candidatus Hodarchaeota archaeon]
MANLDEFFSDDTDRNVQTLVEVTKKFFVFVSQLAEIVDELEKNYSILSTKIDQMSQTSGSITPSTSPLTAPPISPSTSSAPTQ